MSSDQSRGQGSSSTEPFTYAIIPIIGLFVIGSTLLILHMRRRRRRRAAANGGEWPARRVLAPDGSVMFVSRNRRRNPWRGFRSDEGLNELGEAPPPYENKKKTGSPREEADAATGSTAAAEGGATELRDMEEGRRPPEYIAEPLPAVTIDSRRSI